MDWNWIGVSQITVKFPEKISLSVILEYPTTNGGTPQDKANFVLLLKELQDKLKVYGLSLSIAVSGIEGISGKAYNIPQIHPLVDFINLKSYSYHGPWSKETGFNSPLRSTDEFCVESSVNYWLDKGVPSEKLIVGIPFFGTAFTLTNPDENGPGSVSPGAGKPGPYTERAGYLGFNEICPKKWPTNYNDSAVAIYAYRGDQWVSYDDPKTISEKTEFIQQKNLGGAMIWTLENDDFKGSCGQGNYPLLKAVNNGLI